MEGVRANNSLCMGVVSHSYDGFGGEHGWRWWLARLPDNAKRCSSTSLVQREDTDDTRLHHLPGAQLWVGSSHVKHNQLLIKQVTTYLPSKSVLASTRLEDPSKKGTSPNRRGRPNRHQSLPAPRERGLIQPFFR